MIHQFISKLDKRLSFEQAQAHCDIPCGIYDPITAQIAAVTVVRMIDLMTDLEAKGGDKGKDYQNTLSRYIAVKEEHAEKAKAEIDLTKKTIAELKAMRTDAANDELKRRLAESKKNSELTDKEKKEQLKSAEDAEKRTREQAERIADIQRSIRDLNLTEEEGFTRDLQEIENKRADALAANAA